MNVIITNLGTVAVPVSSTQGAGFAEAINPAMTHEIDSMTYTIVTVGDNPSFQEDVAEALRNVAHALKKLVTFWRERQDTDAKKGAVVPTVRVHIDNRGSNALRVRQGDDVNKDMEIAAMSSGEAEGPDYIELRELGVVADPLAGQQTSY